MRTANVPESEGRRGMDSFVSIFSYLVRLQVERVSIRFYQCLNSIYQVLNSRSSVLKLRGSILMYREWI